MRAHLLLAGLLLGASATAHAMDLRGSFSTMLAGRQDPRSGDTVSVIPAYELVSLDANDLGVPGLDQSRLVLNAWGRWQFGKDELHDTAADLNLVYFEARKKFFRMRLGRQHLVLGVGRMDLIDGLDARVDVGPGIAVEAFAGFTVHPELHLRTDSWEGGGRLSYNLEAFNRVGELGVSYLQRREDGELFRNDVGADLHTLVGPARLAALAVMDPEAVALVEGRINAGFAPCTCLHVNLDVERVAPGLMVPLNSIFSVFADAPHDAVGAGVAWAVSPFWSVSADGAGLMLDQSYLGYRAVLSAATYRDAEHRSAIGAELRRLREDDNGYLRGRLYTYLQVSEPIRIGADLYAIRFDDKINAFDRSLIGQASASYDITRSIRLAATVAGGQTPWAKSQVEGMLRFAYGYNVDFGREVAP
ncbi:MAG: hypothetical protein HY903_07440 [Deltaproteobacteria bacterium]|nr:hypothetical protein [Deltaproteobacteria bacterium]